MGEDIDGRGATVDGRMTLAQVCNIEYEEVVGREVDRARMVYDAGLTELARVVTTALNGGKCLLCGKPWAKFEVDNLHAHYAYHQPACECYPKCTTTEDRIGCGRSLHEEWHSSGTTRATRIENGREEYRLYLPCANCGTWHPMSPWRPSTKSKGA